jgi:hypothetical protein
VKCFEVVRQHRPDEAKTHLRQALTIYQQTRSPKAEVVNSTLQELERGTSGLDTEK